MSTWHTAAAAGLAITSTAGPSSTPHRYPPLWRATAAAGRRLPRRAPWRPSRWMVPDPQSFDVLSPATGPTGGGQSAPPLFPRSTVLWLPLGWRGYKVTGKERTESGVQAGGWSAAWAAIPKITPSAWCRAALHTQTHAHTPRLPSPRARHAGRRLIVPTPCTPPDSQLGALYGVPFPALVAPSAITPTSMHTEHAHRDCGPARKHLACLPK